MFGLTSLGLLHTAIALIAVAAARRLQTAIGVFFLLYLAGAGYQVWRLHAGRRSIAVAT
jgi:uncharacterized membrane protein YqjE